MLVLRSDRTVATISYRYVTQNLCQNSLLGTFSFSKEALKFVEYQNVTPAKLYFYLYTALDFAFFIFNHLHIENKIAKNDCDFTFALNCNIFMTKQLKYVTKHYE